MFVIKNKNHLQIAMLLIMMVLHLCHGQTGFQNNYHGRDRSGQTPNNQHSEQLRLNNIRFGQGKPNVGQTPVFDYGYKQESQKPQYEQGKEPNPENRNSFVLPPRGGFGFSQGYPNGNDLGFQHQPFGGGFYPMMGINPHFG